MGGTGRHMAAVAVRVRDLNNSNGGTELRPTGQLTKYGGKRCFIHIVKVGERCKFRNGPSQLVIPEPSAGVHVVHRVDMPTPNVVPCYNIDAVVH